MIKPVKFTVADFMVGDQSDLLSDTEYVQAINILNEAALYGSELVDNLILLQFCSTYSIQQVLKTKYSMAFGWLNYNPTPAEFQEVAQRHHVIIEKGRVLAVYVPLGQEVDDAMLAIDIPNYEINYRFIADCNYRMLHNGLSVNLLSERVAPFKPLLVFKRLIMDCNHLGGTDIHFVSVYHGKQPVHRIEYRINRELKPSSFQIDLDMMQKIAQMVIDKLTPASSKDLDSVMGVTTEVRDLFNDGTCDLRVTAMPDDAGYYVEIAIQTVTTTTRKVDELGFMEEDTALIRQLAQRRTGLTLCTGEMRSGKNTTIFAMLNEIVDQPIRIIEYSNPIENHMNFPQINYRGDIDRLKEYMRMAKKQDLDIAVLNEIPNAEVAFAVRDLVNSAVGVITTTHINRVWHLPNKLREFFGEDYKTIISQLNVAINHKMFRRWKGPGMQKRQLVKEQGAFEMFCYTSGVRQYFVPEDLSKVRYSLQPLVEIAVFTDEMKTAMLNFEEMWRAEQMISNQIKQKHVALENKVAAFVNAGLMSLDEMRKLY